LFLKKIAIILSLTLIVIFATGSFFMHKCYLSSYKKEFKSYISENKKTTATTVIQIYPSELFTNSNTVIWEDENKEVIYKGVLYDVIHIENKNGKVLLTAVSDFQETELKKQFASTYNINNDPSTKNPFELLKQFLTLKTIISSFNTNIQLFPISNFTLQKTESFNLCTIVLNQEIPPPNFFA
jgi:hypothetical protein